MTRSTTALASFASLALPALLAIAGCAEAPVQSAPAAPAFDAPRLASVLAAQADDTKTRYAARRPSQTLAFFGLTPGMTVVEALPGGGWYTKILIDYLGPDGQLIGADYAQSMWPKFGGFATPEFIEGKKTWTTDWPAQAAEWRSDASAPIDAFKFNELPERMHGTADAVLFVRALHNLARFNDDGFLDSALAEANTVLKPGGIVGIVQHEARDTMSDAFATGARGYLKKAYVIERMRAAGFEYLGSRDFNANPKDQPGEDDIVWRLPPSLSGSRDDAQASARMIAIGESNRMTLKFRKPL